MEIKDLLLCRGASQKEMNACFKDLLISRVASQLSCGEEGEDATLFLVSLNKENNFLPPI